MPTLITEKVLLVVSRHETGLDPYIIRLSSPEYREVLYRLAHIFETTESNIVSRLNAGRIVETASYYYRFRRQPVL